MKRFYETASAIKLDDDSGWGVALDGRQVKTPSKNALVLRTEELASAIADEWAAQEDEIAPTSMPLMTFAVSAIDRIVPQQDAIVAELAKYAGSDTLCYRAEEPSELVEKQTKEWDPILKKAAADFELRFVLAGGIVHQNQPEATLQKAKDLLAHADAFELSALHTLISITGSFVLGLFVWKGLLTPAQGFEVGLLEELYQARVWGSDQEAEDRRAKLKADILSAKQFLTLLGEK